MTNYEKLILIVSSPFYLSDFKRYGVKKFLDNNYDITICNICPIVYPRLFYESNKNELYGGQLEKIFFKKNDLKNFLSINKNNLFILSIHHNSDTYFLFKFIKNFNIKYLFTIINIVPSNIERNSSKKLNYKKFLQLEKITQVFKNRVIYNINLFFNKAKSPEYLILGGSKSLESPQMLIVNDSTKRIWTHTFDYDEYLLNEKFASNKKNYYFKKNFAVFIDAPSPLVNHDALIPGISSPLTAEKYFPSLRNFFDIIENQLNLEVIIAAHPRSSHSDRPDYFGKRKVIYNLTVDLIKNSKLVINRNSTAINYAVIYKKSIIFHTSNEILDHDVMNGQINSMANLLDKTPINIDNLENIDLNDQLKINNDLYIKYENHYIKNQNSDNEYLWDIVIKTLKDEKK